MFRKMKLKKELKTLETELDKVCEDIIQARIKGFDDSYSRFKEEIILKRMIVIENELA